MYIGIYLSSAIIFPQPLFFPHEYTLLIHMGKKRHKFGHVWYICVYKMVYTLQTHPTASHHLA